MTPDPDGGLDRGSVASQLSSIQDIHTSHARLFDLWLEQGMLTDQSTCHFCIDGQVLQSLNSSWFLNQDWVDQQGGLVRSSE